MTSHHLPFTSKEEMSFLPLKKVTKYMHHDGNIVSHLTTKYKHDISIFLCLPNSKSINYSILRVCVEMGI